jgi:hypothetical protein
MGFVCTAGVGRRGDLGRWGHRLWPIIWAAPAGASRARRCGHRHREIAGALRCQLEGRELANYWLSRARGAGDKGKRGGQAAPRHPFANYPAEQALADHCPDICAEARLPVGIRVRSGGARCTLRLDHGRHPSTSNYGEITGDLLATYRCCGGGYLTQLVCERYQSNICSPVQNSTPELCLICTSVSRKYLKRCGTPIMYG